MRRGWIALALLAAVLLLHRSEAQPTAGSPPAATETTATALDDAAPPDPAADIAQPAAAGDQDHGATGGEHADAEHTGAEHTDAEHGGGHDNPVTPVLLALV
ncbi:MAG: hypothetical protein KDD11_23385, partial [Acidobacteria bacterium]|nr:hypothetical protein [Acidobacteriota bacterium]